MKNTPDTPQEGSYKEHIHSEGCSHDHSSSTSAFKISIVFNFLFVLFEFYYGYKSQSLSLIGDALHNLGDVFALMIAGIGIYFTKQSQSRISPKMSFGLKKISILAAFFNASTLILTSFYILYEAFEKWNSPQIQNSQMMMIVAAIGFVINMFTALLFHGEHKHELNAQGAFLHLLGDAGISLGVVGAGAIIYFFQWNLIDPLLSIFIACIILWGSRRLFMESLILLLNGVPKSLSYTEIFDFILNSKDVKLVIDLKIWGVSTVENALTCKLKVHDVALFKTSDLQKSLSKKFSVHDITIQVE